MAYCHKCGKRSLKGDNICSHCGAYLRRRGHKTNIFPLILRAAIIILVILLLIFLFKS